MVVVFGMMNLFNLGFGGRKVASLYEAPTMAIRYHNGALLQGNVPVSILWYGKFTAPQKAIVLDFFLSLDEAHEVTPRSLGGGIPFRFVKYNKFVMASLCFNLRSISGLWF